MDFTRDEYDPDGNTDHRVPPMVVPELTPISAPPSQHVVRPEEMVVGPGGKAEPVTGRLQDRPHFIRNVDGVELCGQDGQPWPCEWALAVEAEVRRVANPRSPELVTLEAAARAAGLAPEDLRSRMDRRYG